MALNKAWMKLKNRSSCDYVEGVDSFLNFALSRVRHEDKETTTIRCPCNNCRNILFKRRTDVRFDLLKWGMYEKYSVWDFHGEVLNDVREDENYNDFDVDDDIGITMLQDACGMAPMNIGAHDEILSDNEHVPEEPNKNAKKFYRLLQQYQEPLTVNGTTMTKLAYIVRLLHMKVLYNWSDSSFDSLINLERQAWGIDLPESYYEAKKLIKDLGLDYIKIDACENDCILYWKENENLHECPTCGLSRWKNVDKDSSKGAKVPHKVLRYFPLKPRLQRLYMSRKTAKDMQWHQEETVDDNIMRHPRDSEAWKSFDKEYGEFAKEARNVRFGLACDGFQPFNNSPHSIWPVVLIPYNFPPWICMKPHSFLLTLLIPGPSSPGRNIDVYLRPLIEELKHLWENGVETYDAYRKENFKLRASLLWTINDFPAYGDLSGWTTKGGYACPCCHKETKRTSLKHKGGYLCHRRWLPLDHKWSKDPSSFDNKCEKGHAPEPLSGDDVLRNYTQFTQEKFGKIESKKRKRDGVNCLYGWNKKSIFFELPYWSKLKIRHNLDVMHIEKNVSDNILGTLMNIKGKNKDTIKAQMDLMKMRVRSELHPIVDGNKLRVPVACYSLSTIAKAAICDMFAKLKSPDGYLSNISRCVKDNGKRISCMKSHDHHVFIQQLLPLAIRGFLPKHVYEPLVELSFFFRDLFSRNLTVRQLDVLEKKIPYTLCKLEMVFPPAFFDVMVHLVIHLATEAKIAGPVRYRWMYPVERYIRTLKAYIRNRAHPEGCIAEGYLADECLTFCSRYMTDVDTKFNRPTRNDDNEVIGEVVSNSNLEIFRPLGRCVGNGVPMHLDYEECGQIHSYILQNCDELIEFTKEHKLELQKECPRNVEKRHKAQFSKWILEHVRKLHNEGCVDEDLYNLVCGPSRVVRRYTGYIVNGYRFHTRDRSECRKTQNCGVMVRGDDTSDKEYFGVLGDIYEIQYPGRNYVFIFKCNWFDVGYMGRGYKVDENGFTGVNKMRSLKSDEVFVLESQVEQVFYIEDPKDVDWDFVVKAQPRDFYDMPSDDVDTQSIDVEVVYQQVEIEEDVEEGSLSTSMSDFCIDSLATNAFVVEKEAKVVEMVKDLIKEIAGDDDFINDGDIEVFATSSDEEEDFDSET